MLFSGENSWQTYLSQGNYQLYRYFIFLERIWKLPLAPSILILSIGGPSSPVSKSPACKTAFEVNVTLLYRRKHVLLSNTGCRLHQPVYLNTFLNAFFKCIRRATFTWSQVQAYSFVCVLTSWGLYLYKGISWEYQEGKQIKRGKTPLLTAVTYHVTKLQSVTWKKEDIIKLITICTTSIIILMFYYVFWITQMHSQ